MTTAHEVEHFFLGRVVSDPGWCFYLFALSIKSTPFTIPLAIVSIISLWKAKKETQLSTQQLRIGFSLICSILLFTLCLSLTAKKFSRYLLPVFPMLDILAGIGLFYIVKWFGARFKKKYFRRAATISCITLVLLLTAVPVFALHPYYGTYYNLCWKVTDITKIITVGEASGLDLAGKYLSKKPDADLLSVQVSTLGAEYFHHYFVGTAYPSDKNRIEDTAEFRHADYEVVYIRDSQIGGVPEVGTYKGELEHTITLNGVDLIWIYRVLQKPEE